MTNLRPQNGTVSVNKDKDRVQDYMLISTTM
jgi:hypothetical protein